MILCAVALTQVCACDSKPQKVLGKQEIIVPEEPTGEGETFLKNFELDAIVPIETTDEYLVSQIMAGNSRMVRYKNKLVFLNVSPFYVFVINIETGKVEAFINRKGQGPGEYTYIQSIAVDERNGNILVFDSRKLIIFDIDGKFLREDKIGDYYMSMTCHDGKVIFKDRVEKGFFSYPYEFFIYDIDSKISRKMGDTLTQIDIHYGTNPNLVTSKNIWFTAPLDYNLYKFNNGEIEIPYTLTVKDPIAQTMREKPFSIDVYNIEKIYTISRPVETDRFIFLLTTGGRGIIMINKHTLECSWEKYIKEDRLGRNLYLMFPVEKDENRVLFIIPGEEMFLCIKHFADKISPEWREKISKMGIVEDSNPVLLFYKEKSSITN
jgi:hypothetical protein